MLQVTDQRLLQIISERYALPFIAPPPVPRQPVESPLPVLSQSVRHYGWKSNPSYTVNRHRSYQ